MTKITIERETLERAIDALSMAQVDLSGNLYAGVRLSRVGDSLTALRAALAAQPADYAIGYADGFRDACKPARRIYI